MLFLHRLSFIIFVTLIYIPSFSQTLPVGTPVYEEQWRRDQLLNKRSTDISFMIRPIQIVDSIEKDHEHTYANKKERFLNGKGTVKILPLNFNVRYNTNYPYEWNDGSMHPSKGYQHKLSAGIYAKVGILNVQLQPEWVVSQNNLQTPFFERHDNLVWKSYYDFVLNKIDAPDRRENKWSQKIFSGQSSVRLNYKKLSVGVSTENLWWGPGYRNSLLMSNNAPGFEHLTFNTIKPIITFAGSVEWQLISGKLRGSGILPAGNDDIRNNFYQVKKNNTRYLNGLTVTWQPKWTKGLHLGFSRVFYQYMSDVPHSVGGYLPVVLKFFKGNLGNEDDVKRDQMFSLFFRLQLPKENAEVYAEYGRNDHSWDVDDLIGEPEHSRAYIIGLRKIFNAEAKRNFEVFAEITNLEKPSTRNIRAQESWYSHYQVRHGYTHLGQIIGAGIGPGSSSQIIGINLIKNNNTLGGSIERVIRNNDFFYDAFSVINNRQRHWVDLSFNLNKTWKTKTIHYQTQVSYIRTIHYQWQRRNLNTLSANIAVVYPF